METIKKWEDRVTPQWLSHWMTSGYNPSESAMMNEISELRAALAKTTEELEDWRFTNKVDELQRENGRLRVLASQAESAPVVADERAAFEAKQGEKTKGAGCSMKYIVMSLNGKEEIFVFPRSVDHDRMAEACESIRFGSDRNWKRAYRDGECIAAGFINGGTCHGSSETLLLESRGDTDTALLSACQIIAAATGHCEEGDRCVCGGDLPRVREGCCHWVKP